MCLNIKADEYELGDLNEPANYKAAWLDLESDKWLNAMNVEMQSIKYNDVWDLVDLPPNGKTIGSKWLFKKKIDMDEAIHTYKAHLVAKGYTQMSAMNVPYALTVGSITYDIRCTRPNVAFVQNITSRFQQNRSKLHWTAVKNILKYLRNTKDMFLVYEEAEYIAASDASKEAVWVRNSFLGWESTDGGLFTNPEPLDTRVKNLTTAVTQITQMLNEIRDRLSDGCDMVLGIQWLAILGDIQWNFKTLVMKFTYQGRKVTLREIKDSVPKPIIAILEAYEIVFEVPKELPPHRSHDNTIPLILNTPPISVRPYRHPPTQKDAVELMVKELLDSGVIRNSQSSCSSLIVMVKKKDGT
nr:reverse transcriptase [Tanacetum cinerariifolium]